MVPELIPVLGSQPAGDVSHKPGGRLPLLSARPAVNCATLKRAATNFAAWWTESQWLWTVCLRLLPDSVATAIWTRALLHLLTTQLPSHPLPLCFSWSVQQIQRKINADLEFTFPPPTGTLLVHMDQLARTNGQLLRPGAFIRRHHLNHLWQSTDQQSACNLVLH